jgi:hypothetical protein
LVSSSSGLDFITAQDFTGVASASFGSNASPIFSSTYDSYKLVIHHGSSTDANRTIALRMRANTTDDSTSNYRVFNQGLDVAAAAQNTTLNNQTSGVLVYNSHYAGSLAALELDLHFPFLSQATNWLGAAHGLTAANNGAARVAGVHAVNSSFNGFTLLNSSGNFTNSRVTVYGYRRA